MKKITSILLIVALTFTFVGCDTTTPSTSTTTDPAAVEVDPVAPYLGLIESAATVATGAALQFAVTDTTKRTELANQIYASAKALDALSTGAVPTVAVVQSTLNAYSTGVDVTAYGTYVSAVSSLYATYFNKLKGNGKYAVEVLNALAKGAYTGAKAYATVTAS